ncbi:MAG: Gfo/Idh/MocA family oxidoreductase [Cyclobacteriaceae bacterium]
MDKTRRTFLQGISMLAASAIMTPSFGVGFESKKLKVSLVGTGIRGVGFWGRRLVKNYGNILEFVGLCDHNPGRLKYAQDYIGVQCPTFSNFEEMITKTRPDLVIVSTTDSTHHDFIIKGLEMGCDVITEKPLTTDEDKCEQILKAERASDKNLIVGFNYRWSPYATKVKELLMSGTIGEVSSVEFSWYLNTYHGASYFRRWHGQQNFSGSLWVHKATHHFDLINWWLDTEPDEVFAYGALEYYGSNGPFRGDNCRNCGFKAECDFHWDITKEPHLKKLYVDNEKYDGYIRDNCLFRKEIDIYDKMSAQVRYQNGVVLNYNLTTFSPYEGWKVAFNGTKGRIEAWLDLPYMDSKRVSQNELHQLEMQQDGDEELNFEPIIVHKLWQDYEQLEVPMTRKGHGGGDAKLHDQLFKNPGKTDPYNRTAGVRDGAMSILIGIAARKSIESGLPVKINDLTSLKPK